MFLIEDLIRNAERRPEDAAAQHGVGFALLQRKEPGAAIPWLSRAATLSGGVAEFRLRLGGALAAAERLTEAAEAFEAAFTIDPCCAEAVRRLAALYAYRLDRPERGIELLLRVAGSGNKKNIQIAHGGAISEYSQDYVALCRCWWMRERPQRPSVAAVSRDLGPLQDPSALHLGLAAALVEVGLYEHASRVIAEAPAGVAPAELAAERAKTDLALDGFPAARRRLEEALRAHSDSLILMLNYLPALIRGDDLEAARRYYRSDPVKLAGVNRDMSWLGTTGETVLLRVTGGFGDSIQDALLAGCLVEAGHRVVVQCAAPLVKTLATLENMTAVVAPYDPTPPASRQCRANELLLALDWSWEQIRAANPYLRPPERPPSWLEMKVSEGGFRVGLAWQAGYSPATQDNPYSCRSIGTERLRRLLSIPGVTYYSLCRSDLTPDGIWRDSRLLEDFSCTAAVINAVDLVITVDTSVAHLAGAMGKPTLLMLPYLACWRWRLEVEESCWYPSIFILRQPSPGLWDPVIAQAAGKVSEMAGSARRSTSVA